MTLASTRINTLLECLDNPAHYLEVGVDKGTTFLDVKVPKKYAVDPKFKFDPRAPEAQLPGCHYHETTSDYFFSAIEPSLTFDLIFLDGLHEYEQTYRDFNNALSRLKPGGIIVLDDTFPFDVFSSHRSNPLTVKLRAEFADAGPGWNGDVFKAMVLIASFHPSISFCSLYGKGVKSQTFLWRHGSSGPCQGRPDPLTFQSMIHNMEAAHYLWLLEHAHLMNRVSSIDEVVRLIKASR